MKSGIIIVCLGVFLALWANPSHAAKCNAIKGQASVAIGDFKTGYKYLKHCDLPGVPLLAELVGLLQQHPGLNTGAVLEHWRDREEGRFLHRLAEWSPEVETPDLLPDLRGHLNEIQRQYIEIRINFLSEEEKHRRLNEAETREYGELLIKSHTVRQGEISET